MLVNLKEILEIAKKKQNAVGMFNATGLDSIQAVVAAAEELNAPVILAHAEVHNVYNDIALVAPVMLSEAGRAKVPVCVHLDHGVTFEMIYRALRLGFTSVMYDASHLSYEENLAGTRQVVSAAHAMGVSVEAELGRLVSGEGGPHGGAALNPKDYYTDPAQAAEFVRETKIDALAIAFGTNHGFYKSQPVLDFDVIKKSKKAVNGLPLVMHGGSGVNDAQVKEAVKSGIRKINYYSYMSKAGYDAAKKLTEQNSTAYYHDLAFAAMKAMKEDVAHAIKLFSA
jgi:fructose-bisphosphate aldolase class II